MYNGCTRIGIADRWKICPHKTNIATEKKNGGWTFEMVPF